MIYKIEEYKYAFDTPITRREKQQEDIIVNKIINLLNNNKYDSFEEFLKKNSPYETFLKNNNMENVFKHFGNNLKEEEFNKIIENFQEMIKLKQAFNNESIQTTNIENKEYNLFSGKDKTYIVDNSNNKNSIEEQLSSMQNSQSNFQTNDMNNNTENMFKDMEQNKKTSINPIPLSEIEQSELSGEKQQLFQIAVDYQLNNGKQIRIDLDNNIMIDEQNNIIQIKKQDNEFLIIDKDNQIISEEQNNKENPYQKKLTMSLYNS